MKAQQSVNDSIQAFIKDYNASHGYDAILFKAATLYVNPALDITEEVIEGLNARYNKVKK
jgi:outer membrane protein